MIGAGLINAALESERLILRRPLAHDTDSAVDFFQSDRAVHFGGPFASGRAWRHFAAVVGHWTLLGFGMWAVTPKGDDRIIGLVGPWCPADWPENEIGWLMFGAAEGRGYAAEAARTAIGHAFGVLGWHTAVSYIEHGNARSVALAERLGARPDPKAPQPRPDRPCLVYRHPAPVGTA